MKLALSRDAQKQFRKLPTNEQKKIISKLVSLEQNPMSGKKLEGEINDFRSLQIWPYRIIYEINVAEKRIEVHKIAHRQRAYK